MTDEMTFKTGYFNALTTKDPSVSSDGVVHIKVGASSLGETILDAERAIALANDLLERAGYEAQLVKKPAVPDAGDGGLLIARNEDGEAVFKQEGRKAGRKLWRVISESWGWDSYWRDIEGYTDWRVVDL